MISNRMFVHEDSLESVKHWIQQSLERGSSVTSISRAMIGTKKAELIITKECEMFIQELSDDEILQELIKYINETFKYAMKRSCVTNIIKELIEKIREGIGIDEYADFLTDKLSNGAHQRVLNHITDIMMCYEPYMRKIYPTTFDNMTMNEHEVAMINFIKENLISCVNK